MLLIINSSFIWKKLIYFKEEKITNLNFDSDTVKAFVVTPKMTKISHISRGGYDKGGYDKEGLRQRLLLYIILHGIEFNSIVLKFWFSLDFYNILTPIFYAIALLNLLTNSLHLLLKIQ